MLQFVSSARKRGKLIVVTEEEGNEIRVKEDKKERRKERQKERLR